MKKQILLIFSAIILLLAIPFAVFMVSNRGNVTELRSRAAPATTLDFSPATKSVCIDENFTVNVVVNTGENQLVSSGINIKYDPTFLDAMSVQLGTFLPGAVEVQKNINKVDGIISADFYTTKAQAKSGTGDLVILSFKAKKNGTTTLTFDQTLTTMFGLNPSGTKEGGNIWIKNPSTGTYTISQTCAGTTPSPSVVLSPSPSLIPTITLVPSATLIPTATSTPSATPTLGPASPTPTTTIQAAQPQFIITYPSNGSVITTSIPTIQGIATPSCTVTVIISGAGSQTGTSAVNASGYFGYTAQQALPDGSYQITATEQCAGRAPRTAQTSFAIHAQTIPVTGTKEQLLLLSGISILLILGGWKFLLP